MDLSGKCTSFWTREEGKQRWERGRLIGASRRSAPPSHAPRSRPGSEGLPPLTSALAESWEKLSADRSGTHTKHTTHPPREHTHAHTRTHTLVPREGVPQQGPASLPRRPLCWRHTDVPVRGNGRGVADLTWEQSKNANANATTGYVLP